MLVTDLIAALSNMPATARVLIDADPHTEQVEGQDIAFIGKLPDGPREFVVLSMQLSPTQLIDRS